MDLRGAHALRGSEIKRVEGLHLGEAGLMEPLPDDRLMPRGLLGAQHLMQIVFVRPVAIARLTGKPLKGARDPRQVKGARLRHDEITNQPRAHPTASLSQAS